MEIKDLRGVLGLTAGTVLKVVHPDGRMEFRVIRRARLDPYNNGEDGVPCDREVSPQGVHMVGPIFQGDFDSGVRVFAATEAESAGRRFSYE
jgi:hypothetical protein